MKSPITHETLLESRNRAKHIINKFGCKLITFNEKGIHFKCNEDYIKENQPFIYEDIQELMKIPNNTFVYDLNIAEYRFTLEDDLHIIFDQQHEMTPIYAMELNYMDMIAILLFPTFEEFNEKIKDVIDTLYIHSIHKYMGKNKLNDWFSFLVERYHDWSDNDSYQLYKAANDLGWDFQHYQLPMWI